jgi:hypothetical protein
LLQLVATSLAQMPPLSQVVAPWRGQVLAPQSPTAQVTSHAQALLQLIDPHAAVPMHCTVQAAPPAPHDEILPHAWSPSHRTSQFIPFGHVMLLPPAPSTMHVGGFVDRSHELQGKGHVPPLVTQYPIWHVRPLLQSFVVSHARSSLLRCTVQADSNRATIAMRISSRCRTPV